MDLIDLIVIYTFLAALTAAIAIATWRAATEAEDHVTRTWAARAALASPIWPIALIIAIAHALARLTRALWHDARKDPS